MQCEGIGESGGARVGHPRPAEEPTDRPTAELRASRARGWDGREP